MTDGTALKRPRTKPAEVRREELIDAAQTLFLDKGFEATSVDEIVEAADVAKGTFYFYFKTKDDILLALRTRFVQRFCRHVEKAAETHAPDDWTGRLDASLKAGINGYLDEFRLHDLVFHEFRPSNRRTKHDNPVIAYLTALIEGGARSGAWTTAEPRLTAVMLFSAMHGAVDDAIVSSPKGSRKRLVAEVNAFCRTALGLSAARPTSTRRK
jgi:AcrR family transcriptional regulator